MRDDRLTETYDWMRSMKRTHAGRFIRFAVVGTSGVLVNYAVLYALVEFAGLNQLIAVALANETAILSNFVWNNIWTFSDAGRETPVWVRAARYNIFGLGGLLLSVAVLGLLTYGLGLNYLVANAFAIGAAMTWNYLSNARWTFSVRGEYARHPESHAVRMQQAELPDALD
jgi:dolichol-phosphate mannosyltransferase